MLKSKETTLSIIIVNYKSEHYLSKCLASIYSESESEKYEIIVVNNDTGTNLDKVARKYRQIMIFNRKKNRGFGAACNYGAKKSSGEMILFLNPDTQFIDNYITQLKNKFIQGGIGIGIIGPKLITDEGKVQPWCTGKDLTLTQRIKNKIGIVESKAIWESQEDMNTDWVSGAALTIRKEVFEKIEGFDEKFFMYGEDLDLCAKTRNKGYDVRYCPTITILHSGGGSREGVLKQKAQFLKSSFYYMKKRWRDK